ncbi:hypothetical protein B0H10DRAFT_1956695 [Mycena sp. CBHHK59/15]|nr:hypothetical protein B0H10DRAFT_1956695 [Mycena sp. CBHHK59/15]
MNTDHPDVAAMMANIRLEYDRELQNMRASLRHEFAGAVAEAASSQNTQLREELDAATRLLNTGKSGVPQPDAEMGDAAHPQPKHHHTKPAPTATRDPRTRPAPVSTPTKDPCTTAQATPSPGVQNRSTATPKKRLELFTKSVPLVAQPSWLITKPAFCVESAHLIEWPTSPITKPALFL